MAYAPVNFGSLICLLINDWFDFPNFMMLWLSYSLPYGLNPSVDISGLNRISWAPNCSDSSICWMNSLGLLCIKKWLLLLCIGFDMSIFFLELPGRQLLNTLPLYMFMNGKFLLLSSMLFCILTLRLPSCYISFCLSAIAGLYPGLCYKVVWLSTISGCYDRGISW